MRNHVLLIVVGLLIGLLGAGAAHGQTNDARRGLASHGLCGLSYVAEPTCPRTLGVSATAGYGYTESVGTVDGSHHRLAGALGIGVVPLPWLALALRFDGRLDLHPPDEQGDDLTGTGDPRLFLRGGHALRGGFSLGGELVAWFPGTDAPSFEPSAISVDLKLLLAQKLERRALSLLATIGARLDQSSNSAPDLARLRPGDRLALNLSDSHAVLIALGATTRALARSELFAELALDWLVGPKAPAFSKSPLRASVGARYFFRDALSAEVSTTVALNGRPALDPNAALVPVEPRVLVSFGLRYGYALFAPPPQPEPAPEPAEPLVEEPRTANLEGVLVDHRDAALPDVTVTLRVGDAQHTTMTDGEGRYRFEQVPLGTATLEASAPGFAAQTWTIEVTPDLAPQAKRPLAPKGNLGTLRVLTRTFASEPLVAAVTVRDARGKKVAAGETNAQGLLEFDLPPGRYAVIISAAGYRPHEREVQIERYAVAILNVDMRAKQ